MSNVIPLHFLSRGEVAEIDQLVGRVDEVHRLEELGLRSGVVVEMLQPGTPCIVGLAGHRLCFRQNDAVGILVRAGATR
ncbi:MAG: FeoA family protein [Pirellulaceae bacterium]|nr:FeoA family protein [Pirellulaceae bacterium]MDP6717304.1 FeoA family protein [Pirellulaceae bacterium]HJN09856.1 FeoA family protein [Pirellulaceae bacterium]